MPFYYPVPVFSGIVFDFVESGCVWTADNGGASPNGSMTAGVAWIGGTRFNLAAITANVFTVSKDTYIDVATTGVVTYTEVANNAASSALAANNLRLGIIVTDGTSIPNTQNINQGQETKILPIASSIPYAVTDSIGNLICPRDPARKLLGYRATTSNATTTNTTATQITGLTCPVIVPTGRKIKVIVSGPESYTSVTTVGSKISVWDGTVGSGTQVADTIGTGPGGTSATGVYAEGIVTPTTANKTYNAGLHAISAATATAEAAATRPLFIKVELE